MALKFQSLMEAVLPLQKSSERPVEFGVDSNIKHAPSQGRVQFPPYAVADALAARVAAR